MNELALLVLLNSASKCQTPVMAAFDHSETSVWLLVLGLHVGHSLQEEALFLKEVSVPRAGKERVGWIQPKVPEETLL